MPLPALLVYPLRAVRQVFPIRPHAEKGQGGETVFARLGASLRCRLNVDDDSRSFRQVQRLSQDNLAGLHQFAMAVPGGGTLGRELAAGGKPASADSWL
jgi:hypothetical protein